LILHRAAWVVPIAAPPVRDGWVAVEAGRIVACGGGDPPPGAAAVAPPFEGASSAIMPALVNAHTHLEVSHMRGLVPPARSFDAWVRSFISLRRAHPDPFAADIVDAMIGAIAEARNAGTGLIGDISNTLATPRLLADAGMPGHVFYEVLGFNAADPEGLVREARARVAALDPGDGSVRVTVTPHAPYSVSPALFRAVADQGAGALTSIHLGESPEEVSFLNHGGGPIQAALEALGAWNPRWTPPRCGPVEYIGRFGLLSDRLLAVHGVHLSYRELAQLAGAGATLVTCPRSNHWVGAGDPPVDRFYASGVRVAIGTDSLASVEDLNVFAEMAAIRRLSSDVPARAILESATRIGAEALGFGGEFGTIEPGKQAALIAVRVPDAAGDVEEYLAGGITPAQVAWLDGSEAREP
jgi:cytosine/adenosine deaminase-related metal-dependent hydrolase